MTGEYWAAGLDALDFKNYVAVNKTLIRKFGLHVAVLVGEFSSEARFHAKRGELHDGWFYATVDRTESHTGLNAYYQREAISKMADEGLVEVCYKGMPKKRHIRVNPKAVIDAMSDSPVEQQSLTQCTTSGETSERQVVDSVNAINLDNQHRKSTNTINVEEPRLFEVEPRKQKRSKKVFTPPTLEEVTEWVRKKGYHFDARQFYDYYEAENWHMGNGRAVKSWKRCCVTWEKHHQEYDTRQCTDKSYDDVDVQQFVKTDAVVGNWEDRRG